MDTDPITRSTLETITRFNEAINAHDLDLVMALLTEDSVFENTYPPPEGERFEGHAAVRRFWREFFAASPSAVFEFEEEFGCGDRAVVRWLYRWVDTSGVAGHLRGVDLFRVRNGKVAEKLSYVKG